MSKVFIEESTLIAIGDSIRSKGGTSALIAPLDMPAAITNLPSGGGGGSLEIPAITGNCDSMFMGGSWDWLINGMGNQMTSTDITNASNMFNGSQVQTIPFTLNMNTTGSSGSMLNMFADCSQLKTSPVLKGVGFNLSQAFRYCENLESIDLSNIEFPTTDSNDRGTMLKDVFAYCRNLKQIQGEFKGKFYNISGMFQSCCNLNNLHDHLFEEATWKNGTNTNGSGNVFYYCYSLRRIPSSFMTFYAGSDNTSWNQGSSSPYYQMFNNCLALDEVINLPVISASNRVFNSNGFDNTFTYCWRLKDFTFQTNEDGSAKTAKWTNQTIDLSYGIGYIPTGASYMYNCLFDYSSGITTDKEAIYQSTASNPHWQYESIKDDPNIYTKNEAYARYNRQSAIRTFASLPDTTACIASNGGTNTIKLNKLAGYAYERTEMAKLTDAEIAVATAKGWTVTLV